MKRPTAAALWLLNRSGAAESLIGDLIETFHEGRSPAWFWKQVLIAIAINALSSLRHHCPHLAFALTGTLSPLFLQHSMFRPHTGLLARREFRWVGFLRTLLFAHLALLFIPYMGNLLPPLGPQVYIPCNWPAIFYLIETVPGFLILAALFLVLLASA